MWSESKNEPASGEVNTLYFPYPILITSLQFAAIFLSVVGNGAVILAVITNKTVRKVPNNMFICSLSITDFLIGAIVIPLDTLTGRYDRCIPMPKKSDFSKYLIHTQFVLVSASMWQLCIISFDRYQFILHSLRYYSTMTKVKSVLFFTGGWIMGVFVYLTFVIPLKVLGRTPGVIKYVYINISAWSTIAMTIILVCYARIIIFLNKRRNRRQSVVMGTFFNRTTLILGLLIFTFFLFVAPTNMYHIYRAVTDRNDCRVHTIVHSLVAAYAPINPFIYTIFNANFREAVFDLFNCRCLKSNAQRKKTFILEIDSAINDIDESNATVKPGVLLVSYDQDIQKQSGIDYGPSLNENAKDSANHVKDESNVTVKPGEPRLFYDKETQKQGGTHRNTVHWTTGVLE